MYCYKLTLAYDGTHYSGWQIQPNAISIQELVQKAVATLLGAKHISVIGSGRTDAGVHAKGQIAHFKTDHLFDLSRLLLSLNGLLPRDIRVKKVELAPADFHAQYSAIGKEYHYHLFLDRIMDPFCRLYSWHVMRQIDLSLLIKAGGAFVGTHDFTSFANESHCGAVVKDPVRTVHRLEIIQSDGGVRLEFEGNGFLYKMVRNIVGTMVDVASMKRPLSDIPLIFGAKDRRQASAAAPPQGLFLMRVDY